MERFKNWRFAWLKSNCFQTLNSIILESESNFKGDANKFFQQIILPKGKDQIKVILLSKSFQLYEITHVKYKGQTCPQKWAKEWELWEWTHKETLDMRNLSQRNCGGLSVLLLPLLTGFGPEATRWAEEGGLPYLQGRGQGATKAWAE